jgi:hypothetical protein
MNATAMHTTSAIDHAGNADCEEAEAGEKDNKKNKKYHRRTRAQK